MASNSDVNRRFGRAKSLKHTVRSRKQCEVDTCQGTSRSDGSCVTSTEGTLVWLYPPKASLGCAASCGSILGVEAFTLGATDAVEHRNC